MNDSTACRAERVVWSKQGQKIIWPCVVKGEHDIHRDVVGWKWTDDDQGDQWRTS